MTQIQHWINNTFGTDKNTSATIIITLLIFISGYLVGMIFTSFNNYKKRSLTRKIFYHSISSIIKGAKKQSKGYIEAANSFNLLGETAFTLARVDFHEILSIKEIGYKESFESLFNGIENIKFYSVDNDLKLKAFQRIWEMLNNISFWEGKAFNDVQEFLAKFNTANEKRNVALENYRQVLSQIVHETNNNPVPKAVVPFLMELDSINLKWQAMGNRTAPYVVHKKLVIPLRILTRRNKELPIVHELNKHLLQVSHQYENMYSLVKGYKHQYKLYSLYFRFYYRTLNKSLRIVQSCG